MSSRIQVLRYPFSLEARRATQEFARDIGEFVMDALKDAGYRIPGDISVIGCGNMSLSERTIPPLTTIDQNMYMMGAQGFEMLLRRIHEGDTTEYEAKIIEPRLVIRESCREM